MSLGFALSVGQSLQVEELDVILDVVTFDVILDVVTFDDKDLKLWPLIKK